MISRETSSVPAEGPARRQRKAQVRSVVTRERILDAALECLVECGYAHTATTDIAARAGVSRGAQLHHFRTRPELLAATVGHLAEKRLAELRSAIAHPPPGEDPSGAAVEFLWSVLTDSTAYATLELVVAARTDPDLREHLRPVVRRFEEALRLLDRELSPNPQRVEEFNTLRNLLMLAIQGLALMRIVRHDDEEEYSRNVLESLKTFTRNVVDIRPENRM